ncbi:MAG: two-component system response regulator [Gammaproteobacteria bacterium]|nr:two-component system response regulator [Gammaproteobacteria bacterium]
MNKIPGILVVDDERFHLNVIVDLLSGEHKILVAKNGERALEIAASDPPPDLILLDILMPGMDGYEVCQKLKANAKTCAIPVIFLTVKRDVVDETHGFNLGAVDYITKPISPPIVRARVKTHLALKRALTELEQQKEHLEERVQERTLEIAHTQDVAIYCLASLAETRDSETGNHIRRTQHYVKALAEHLKDHPRFQQTLSDEVINLIYKSAPLHDIGKVGIPDRILLKPGKLDSDEWQEMKRHAAYGKDAINRAEQELGSTSFLAYAGEIALTHHEKWDGSGYPDGLKGDEIPISGRLMAISDVYDALISKRVYKPAFSHEKAVKIIIEGKGAHFDPDVVDAFLALEQEFVAIAKKFADLD